MIRFRLRPAPPARTAAAMNQLMLARRRAQPAAAYIARMTLTAVAAYGFALLLPGTTARPVLAPLTALLVLQASFFRTVRSAVTKVGGVTAGDVTVTAVASGDTGAPVAGKIAFFDNTIDTNSGTIAVKAIFDNAQERLWPGEFVNVSVTERTDPNAITVPQAAVLIGQNTTYVYVIKDDNTAEMRPVKVARTVDGVSVISDGLNPGERVATDGQLRLTNGSQVDVRSTTGQPKTDSKS